MELRVRTIRDRTPRGGMRGGFSLVEVMIALLLLLFVALGVLPLFTQAMVNNLAGHQSTTVANHARTQLESFVELPFNHPDMTISGDDNPDVDGDDNMIRDWYSLTVDDWVTTEPTDAEKLWTRTTTVRQFTVDDLTTPLDAGADPRQIHLKEIRVEVTDERGRTLGGAKDIVLRAFKAS